MPVPPTGNGRGERTPAGRSVWKPVSAPEVIARPVSSSPAPAICAGVITVPNGQAGWVSDRMILTLELSVRGQVTRTRTAPLDSKVRGRRLGVGFASARGGAA